MTPKQTDHVIAKKRAAGRVTVHNHESTAVTLCGLTPEWGLASWLWLEFRTLNPERVVLCKTCWR